MISIIVPVYNSAQYLKSCIDSIISQNYHDTEIILVNDGSTDDSSTLCDQWQQNDSRIKVIHKANGGVSSARNAGIEASKGDYLIFLDADDTLKPGILKKMSDAITDDTSICIGGFEYVYNDHTEAIQTKIAGTYPKSVFLKDLFVNLYTQDIISAVTCKLYRKKEISKHNLRFNENLTVYEDILFALKNIEVADHITIIYDEVFNYIQTNSQSALSKYQPKFIESSIKYLEEVFGIFPTDMYTSLCCNVTMRALRQEYRMPQASKTILTNRLSLLRKCTENLSLIKVLVDKQINKDAKLVCLLLKFKCYNTLYIYGKRKA